MWICCADLRSRHTAVCPRVDLLSEAHTKALFDMMDGMDFVDDMDTEKIHLGGCVHNVHSVHCLDKFNWLQLPNLV